MLPSLTDSRGEFAEKDAAVGREDPIFITPRRGNLDKAVVSLSERSAGGSLLFQTLLHRSDKSCIRNETIRSSFFGKTSWR
jgi:hypothetical protein